MFKLQLHVIFVDLHFSVFFLGPFLFVSDKYRQKSFSLSAYISEEKKLLIIQIRAPISPVSKPGAH